MTATGFSDDVVIAAISRYSQIFFAYGALASPPKGMLTIATLEVNVLTADDTLRFGIDESYNLSVSAASGRATLTANTVFGAVWGLETLSQLTQRVWLTSAAGAINGSYYRMCDATVVDYPRFPFRSILLDTSRHFISKTATKAVIDMMSYFKLNALHWHITDDQSWPLYIPSHPEISNGSAYSPLHVFYPADVRELVQYARVRGVVLYPELDFPAHSASLYNVYPTIGCYVPPPVGYRVLIDPLFPGLWALLTDIFADVDALFPKAYPVHIGGDEVDRNTWDLCPNVTAWQAQPGPLQGWDITKARTGVCVHLQCR
jgi:hexosaminidase